ncbi:MAG: HlyC/CorC family transporter [Clostridia bacterium]|nr:HlyC/CorC family transporter [Clostridia bacterium]
MEYILPIILQIVLISLNAIFASAEIAVISSSSAKLEKLRDEGNKRAKRLLKISSNPSKFLSTIQVAITLASLLGSAFAADSFGELLSDSVVGWLAIENPTAIATVESVCVLAITLVLSFFSIVFGELVPKRVAMKNPEKTALGISGLLSFVSICFTPFVWILTKTTNGILRLFKINPNEEDSKVTEEEIRLMVNSSTLSGEIDESENEMIQNIFEFDDISIAEICTHRTDVTFLYKEDSFADWKKTILSTRHGFYPVCGENADDVVGVLNAKKFFRCECNDQETAIKKTVEKPFLVPETIKADTLFEKMKETRNYFAIVIDEYGGTTGVVTMHDLLEVLVGELNDKDDVEIVEIKKTGDNVWEIQGTAPIDDVCKELDITLDSESFDTFGGYIFGTIDVIPDDGTVFELETDTLSIKVTKIEDHRIEKCIVTKKIVEKNENDE